jgi:hypothetical protein
VVDDIRSTICEISRRGFKGSLKKDFEIETVGREAEKNNKIVIFLDAIARGIVEN